MILNVVLLILGALFLFYGIRNKLKFWIIAGALLLCFGAVAAYVDYTVGAADGVDTSRLPFLLDRYVR